MNNKIKAVKNVPKIGGVLVLALLSTDAIAGGGNRGGAAARRNGFQPPRTLSATELFEGEITRQLAQVYAAVDAQGYEKAEVLLNTLKSSASQLALTTTTPDGTIPQSSLNPDITIQALELISAGVRLTAKEITSDTWQAEVQELFKSQPDQATLIIRRWVTLMRSHGPDDQLITLVQTPIPIEARTSICEWLMTNRAPGQSATVEQAKAWFLLLSPLCSDLPAEGPILAFQATRWMDSHGHSDVADTMLDAMINEYPNSDMSIRALTLRCQSLNPGPDRDSYLSACFEAHRNDKVGQQAVGGYVRKQIVTHTMVTGLRALEASVAFDSRTQEDGRDNAFYISRLLDQLCDDHLQSGISRPASKGFNTPEFGVQAEQKLSLAIRLFREYCDAPADNSLSAVDNKFNLSAHLLAEVLYNAATEAGAPNRMASTFTTTPRPAFEMVPKTLASRLRMFLDLENSQHSPLSDKQIRILILAYLSDAKIAGTSEQDSSYKTILSDPELSRFGLASLFQVALEATPPRMSEADATFDQFIRAGGNLVSPEHSKWGIRRALKAVQDVNANDRLKCWETQFDYIESKGFTTSEQVIDELTSELTLLKSDPILGQRVISACIINCTSASHIYRLQQLRIDFLCQSQQWDEAANVARINILFSIANQDGPVSALLSYLDVLKRAKKNVDLQAFENDPCGWLDGHAVAIDTNIINLAKTRLTKHYTDISPQHRILLEMLTNQTDTAVTDSYNDFMSNPNNDTASLVWLSGALKSESLSGALLASHSLKQHHTEIPDQDAKRTQLMALLESTKQSRALDTAQSNLPWILAQLDVRITKWIGSAYNNEQAKWAVGLGVLAFDGLSLDYSLEEALDKTRTNIPVADQEDNAIPVLQAISSRYPNVPKLKEIACLKIAKILGDQNKYNESLTEIDKLRGTSALSDLKSVQGGIVRGLALIHLDRQAEALQQLQVVEQSDGTVEEHGQLAFLIGWIYLQQDNNTMAIKYFDKVVTEFSKSTFAAKSKPILSQLKTAK